MSMTPEHIFYIVWFICAVITTYGASRSHMKTDGEVSLLAVAGYINEYYSSNFICGDSPCCPWLLGKN